MSLTALFNATDNFKYPETMGFSPLQLKEGWGAWAKSVLLDETCKATDGNALLHGAAGWGPTRTIGYFANGNPVTSEAAHFRQLEHSDVGKIHPHLWGKGFLDGFEHRGAIHRNMTALVGAPSVDTAPTEDSAKAYDELRACHIAPIIDALGVVVSGGCAKPALVGMTIYGQEPGGQPCELEGASYSLSLPYFTRRFTRKPTRADQSVVMGTPDPEERLYKCAVEIGKGFVPCCGVRPEPLRAWGEASNFSLKQVDLLMRMTG